MRRPNRIEGEIKGDLPHPMVLDYAAAGTWLQGISPDQKDQVDPEQERQ